MLSRLSSLFAKTDTPSRTSRPVRPVPVPTFASPYKAATIKRGIECCKRAIALQDERFLATALPKLPLAGCDVSACRCRFVHHDDRRAGRDRRLFSQQVREQFGFTERRHGKERRPAA